MGKQKRKILLVEDEAILAMDERLTIERFGYAVQVAGNGQKAVDIACNDPAISLVLMDIDLGKGIDGTQAAEQILEKRELPIVFLTSHAEREMVQKVKGITRYGYVLKNSGEFVLEEAISMALELFEASACMESEIESRKQTEQTLRERNHFIETVLEHLPIGLAVNYVDKGKAHYINPKFAEIYGWPPEELTDIASFFEKVYPDEQYRKEITDRIMADISSGDPSRMHWEEIQITRKDGTKGLVDAKNIPIPDQNFMISTVQDVTEKKASKATNLLQSEALEAIGDAVIVTDVAGAITYHNSAAASLYGFPKDTAVGQYINEVIPLATETSDEHRQVLAAVGKYPNWSGEIVISSTTLPKSTLAVANYPLKNENGQVDAVVLISRRKHHGPSVHKHKPGEHYLEKELYELAHRDSSIFSFLREGSLDGMWYWDLEHQENEWMDNRFWELFGYDPEEKRHDPAEWQDLIHPEDLKVALENFHEHLKDPDHPYDQVVRYRHKEGGWVHVRCRGIAIRAEDGTPIRMLGVHNDLTELMAKIETERTLRHELNHRIKNNLAIVKSLISLKESEDDQGVDLTNIQNQIDTIRLVHEKLQATEELSSIELIPYVEAVLQSVLDPTVQTEITGFAVEVSSQVAVPLGLILNELATNAIKHGFTDNGEKRFVVEVRDPHSEGSKVKIMVWNSGSPIPENVSLESPTSLGMRLVAQLVSQLGSTLAVTRGPNPTFEFEVESSKPPTSS